MSECQGTPGSASWGRCEKPKGHAPPCTHDPVVAVFDGEAVVTLLREDIVFVSQIAAKAHELETKLARRPTHVAVHPSRLKGVSELMGLTVIHNAVVEEDTAYLWVNAK